MPYEAIDGGHERASRIGHAQAAVRALADTRTFHVPAEHLPNRGPLEARIWSRNHFPTPSETARLGKAIAIDGSRIVEPVRDGLPSVVYGYVQTAAVYVDLDVMETQRAQRFVDPTVLRAAVNSALVSADLPSAGAYARDGIDIRTSWRELLDQLFRTKKVEVNNLDCTLLDLLLRLHGSPSSPAQTLPVNCPHDGCGKKDVPVPGSALPAPVGMPCPECRRPLFPTDVLRIDEEVVDEGSNETALARLMSVIELLVLAGLTTLLWDQHRNDLLPEILFIVDGPLAVFGPPAPLRSKALAYFQDMSAKTPRLGPYIVGLEKSGTAIDFARRLAYHDVLKPGDLLVCDDHVISAITNTANPAAYGKDTYWGRKFIYRTTEGIVVVPTIVPLSGPPYDSNGGQADPVAYPTLPAILDVLDRTGSSMHRDAIIPVALAHGKAAFPIGVGTDVLRLVAKTKLGLASPTSARQ